MRTDPIPRGKLMVELPANRYRILSPAGRAPCVGDILDLDQGYTGSDGMPMVMAYFPGLGDDDVYEAEVYESELELLGLGDTSKLNLAGRRQTTLYLVRPNSRPAYYQVADHIWGSDANIDSDGNSRTPTDTAWTELSLSLRDSAEDQQVHIDPISTSPLILQIRSPDAGLAEKTAAYLSELTNGSIERSLPLSSS